MAYSGRYKVKNPKKYKGDFTKVVYRSGGKDMLSSGVILMMKL